MTSQNSIAKDCYDNIFLTECYSGPLFFPGRGVMSLWPLMPYSTLPAAAARFLQLAANDHVCR
jgi:hypothetical protein